MSMVRPFEQWQSVLSQFERLAHTLGVRIEYMELGEDGDVASSDGGLCQFRGQNLVLVDRRLPPHLKCRVLALDFGRFDLSEVFAMPAVRQMIERYAA